MLALICSVLRVLGSPPLPNARQLEFMEMETIQFMHFNVDTAWKPSTCHALLCAAVLRA